MPSPTARDLTQIVKRAYEQLQDAQLSLGAIAQYSDSEVATKLRADVQRIRDVVKSMRVFGPGRVRPNRRRRTSRRRRSSR